MFIKQSTSIKLPLGLTLDGSGVGTVTYDQVTMRLAKDGGASASRTVLNSEWAPDASVPGLYWFSATTTDTSALNYLVVYVSAPGIDPKMFAFFVVSADLAEIESSLSGVSVDLSPVTDRLDRVLGLTHENSKVVPLVFDGMTPRHMLSGKRYAWDSAAHAQAGDVSVGLVASWTITCTYAPDGALTSYLEVKD